MKQKRREKVKNAWEPEKEVTEKEVTVQEVSEKEVSEKEVTEKEETSKIFFVKVYCIISLMLGNKQGHVQDIVLSVSLAIKILISITFSKSCQNDFIETLL